MKAVVIVADEPTSELFVKWMSLKKMQQKISSMSHMYYGNFRLVLKECQCEFDKLCYRTICFAFTVRRCSGVII